MRNLQILIDAQKDELERDAKQAYWEGWYKAKKDAARDHESLESCEYWQSRIDQTMAARQATLRMIERYDEAIRQVMAQFLGEG